MQPPKLQSLLIRYSDVFKVELDTIPGEKALEAPGSSASQAEHSARLCGAAPTVFLAFLALVALIVLVAQYARRHAYSAPDAASLASRCAPPSACWEELQLFLATLRSSVEPCHSFESHVCDDVIWSNEMTRETPDDMRFRWYLQGSRFLDQYEKPAPAVALYRACLDQWDSDVGDEQRVLQFLRDRGLLWPANAAGSHHALYVLLDLIINWGVPFWFELSLRRLPRESRHVEVCVYTRVKN
ncbi:uncharacterized protein [Dermacentor andersoni]|uniref:uncharacterized protein n=1 Tax=Dermacentor andersoni TaxID=34620 RepID=UPI003B3B5869